MKRFFSLIALSALLCATPALAQSTFPTVYGGRVAGVVTMSCDVNGANCAPLGSSSTSANQVQGNVASDAVDAGNPVEIGGVAQASGVVRPAVSAAGDRVSQAMTLNGATVISGGVVNAVSGWEGDSSAQQMQSDNGSFYKLAVVPYNWTGSVTIAQRGDANGSVTQPAISSTFWNYAAVSGGIVSSTADVAIKAAAGASVRNYLCTLDISHDLLSAATEIVAKDGATVIWRARLQTPAIDIGGGAGKITFSPCLRGTANTALNVALITSVTGGVYVNATGYTGS